MKKLSDDEYKKRVFSLVGDEYDVLEEYIDTKTKLLTRHNVCGNSWKICPNKFITGRRCPFCYVDKKRQAKEDRIRLNLEKKKAPKIKKNNKRDNSKTKERFEKEFSNKKGQEYTLINEFVDYSSKIKIMHQCGHIWESYPSNILRHGCPSCARGRARKRLTKTNEEFENDVLTLGEGEYILEGEYINSKNKVKILHLSCGNSWFILPGNFIKGRRCPFCSHKPLGESRIERFLKNRDIGFKSNFRFVDCKDSYPLSFDFYIFAYNTLIEYNGIQHYEPVKIFGGEDQLEIQRNHDEIKYNYCNENGILLIIIPYWEYKNIEKILEYKLCESISEGGYIDKN